MFHTNRERPLKENQKSELMDFVASTMNRMLEVGQTIQLNQEYGLLMNVALQDDAFVGAVYVLSDCEIDASGKVDFPKTPLFLGTRNYYDAQDHEYELDQVSLERMDQQSREALIFVSGLFLAFKPNASAEPIGDLSEEEQQQIVSVLKSCLRKTTVDREPGYGTLEELDTFVMSTPTDNGINIALFKLSDCVLMLGSPVELPMNPMYMGELDHREGFSANANSNFQGTKYERVFQYVHTCLGNSLRTI